MRTIRRLRDINENSAIVLKNVMISSVVKGASLGLSLVMTPAFIRYFNHNTILGVWYTLLSVLVWVLNFDLGIGNGIRNHLVQDFSNNDFVSARKTLSSGMFSSVLLVLGLTAAGMLLIRKLDLNWLFNVDEHIISRAVLVKSALLVYAGIMLRCFLSCVSSVFYALQMSSVNSLLSLCVSALQFLFVTFVRPKDAEQGLLMLSVAYAIISNLPVCIAGITVFATKLRECRPSIRYVEKHFVRKVMGVGTVFFTCQIMYMLLMNTNEFLISRLFEPKYTTEYTLYYKLTGLISMIASLVLTPLWSVITKAMEEQQYDWVKKLYKRLKLVGAFAMTIQFTFVFVQQFVMNLWLGEDAIQVEYPIAIAFACFGSVFLYTSILSTIVCGMSRMRLQMICYSVGVVGKFVVIFMFAPIVDHWSVVVWSNVLVLLPYCVAQQIDLDRYFKKL